MTLCMAWLKVIVEENNTNTNQATERTDTDMYTYVQLQTNLLRVLGKLERAFKKLGFALADEQQKEEALKHDFRSFVKCSSSLESRWSLVVVRQAILNYVQYTLLGVQQSYFYVCQNDVDYNLI